MERRKRLGRRKRRRKTKKRSLRGVEEETILRADG
jgi:hypothetical protein